ncbi:MAG: potassium channel family protein [Microthrixaceae bacterium]
MSDKMSDMPPENVTTEQSPQPSLLLRISRWELLVVFLLLLGIFASRQTGSLPGRAIRLLDVALAAAALAMAMRAGGASHRTRIVHGGLGALAIVLAVTGVAMSSFGLQRLAAGIGAYLVAVVFVYVLSVVLHQEHVTGDTLFGALAAYLSAAIMFAMIYTLVARSDPAAFEPPQPVIDGQTDLYYFSFVTVTSLGYGDIAPASDLTRVLAPIEAVVGLILIAALVGRIVALLVAQNVESVTQLRLDVLARAVERLDDRDRSEKDQS